MCQDSDDIKKVDVILPVYKPDKSWEALLKRLVMQTVKPSRVLILNTEGGEQYTTEILKERLSEEASTWKISGSESIEFRFVSVKKEEFNHGGTRNLGTELTGSEYILFMTQDAIPYDTHLIEYLLSAFDNHETAVAYARQVPKEGADYMECLVREYNYPEQSRVKTFDDVASLGIKTYFCSNVCAMYARNIFNEIGRFENKLIFGEDMLFAARAIEEGYAVCYEARAKVIHSHQYSLKEQFKRNFDIGVSHEQQKKIYDEVSSTDEGIAMVKATMKMLCKEHHYKSCVHYASHSAVKYLGYSCGKRYKKIPKKMIMHLSSNREFWKSYKTRGE